MTRQDNTPSYLSALFARLDQATVEDPNTVCGIVGIFDLKGRRTVDRSLLLRMNDSVAHRGPDADGLHTEPGLGLGHRRLSIIDIASGQQPLSSEDGNLTIVFNGEIYNFRQLRKELEGYGYRFKTHSDTEVIVYAWARWGEDCVKHLNGMFAFALWDRAAQTLFLARDRLGIKPLYHADLPDGQVIFGSELKALLLHPMLSRDMDASAVEDYFTFGYVPDPKTILRQARKLEPGATLTLRRGHAVPESKRYWDVSFARANPAMESEIRDELIARLRESVKRRMVAEVPLGAFLSGGVDSSAVVAVMQGLSDEPVNTCSISFGDPKFNEAQYAAEVAERYGTNHTVDEVDPAGFDLIDTLVDAYDEPFADSSALPTYRVCQLARRHVTVALSGDGGDENFAGYRRYRWSVYEERIRSLLPAGLRRPVFGVLGDLYPKLDWAPRVLRAKSTFQALARNRVEGYLHTVSILPDDQRGRLFSNAFRRELQGYRSIEVFLRHAAQSPTDNALSMLQYLDFKTYLPGDILTKVDRASMAHALEVRVPLLDHEFVDWVSGLGADWKLRGREGKYVLKKALEPYLPDSVLYRPKMGFAVPIANWFRGPLRQRLREAVLGSGLAETGIFDRRELERLVDQHQSGLRDYSAILWALLMFDGSQRRLLSLPAAA